MMDGKLEQNFKFAIIGCGLIGSKRAGALPAGSLRWACDLDSGKANALAARVPGCQAVTETDVVWRATETDVVIVSVANVALGPIALAAVQHGKHVLVEKPGAISIRELNEIAEAAHRTGARVRLGYNHRYHPAFRKINAITQAENLGRLMFVRARYGHGGRVGYDREWRADPKLSGGGELIDQGVHLIDLASIWLGDFARVEGRAVTYFWDMPVDDNAFISLTNAAGNTAWLHVSCTEWKNLFSFELYFQRAKLHVEGLGGNYGIERLYFYKMLPEMGPPETVIYEFPGGDESWAWEMEEFLQDILTGREPVPGLREGIRTLEVVEKIYRESGFGF
jgi:predicted dehydrogenase